MPTEMVIRQIDDGSITFAPPIPYSAALRQYGENYPYIYIQVDNARNAPALEKVGAFNLYLNDSNNQEKVGQIILMETPIRIVAVDTVSPDAGLPVVSAKNEAEYSKILNKLSILAEVLSDQSPTAIVLDALNITPDQGVLCQLQELSDTSCMFTQWQYVMMGSDPVLQCTRFIVRVENTQFNNQDNPEIGHEKTGPIARDVMLALDPHTLTNNLDETEIMVFIRILVESATSLVDPDSVLSLLDPSNPFVKNIVNLLNQHMGLTNNRTFLTLIGFSDEDIDPLITTVNNNAAIDPNRNTKIAMQLAVFLQCIKQEINLEGILIKKLFSVFDLSESTTLRNDFDHFYRRADFQYLSSLVWAANSPDDVLRDAFNKWLEKTMKVISPETHASDSDQDDNSHVFDTSRQTGGIIPRQLRVISTNTTAPNVNNPNFPGTQLDTNNPQVLFCSNILYPETIVQRFIGATYLSRYVNPRESYDRQTNANSVIQEVFILLYQLLSVVQTDEDVETIFTNTSVVKKLKERFNLLFSLKMGLSPLNQLKPLLELDDTSNFNADSLVTGLPGLVKKLVASKNDNPSILNYLMHCPSFQSLNSKLGGFLEITV